MSPQAVSTELSGLAQEKRIAKAFPMRKAHKRRLSTTGRIHRVGAVVGQYLCWETLVEPQLHNVP